MSHTIAIIGAGTAGLASARFLHRLGHHVTVFERADTLHPAGAGLLLQPSGQQVLQDLGLLQKLQPLCSTVRILHGDGLRKNHSTKPVMTLHYADAATGMQGLGVHRANLCKVLAEDLPSDVSLRFSIDIQRYKPTTGGVELFTGSQRRQESSLGIFDAVIVANGSKSQLRPRGFCQPYRWGAFWSILPDTGATPRDVLAQRYHRANRMLGLLPSGHLHHDSQQTPLVSLFWSLPTRKFADVIAAGLPAWKQDVRQLWPELDSLLAQISDFSQLIPASYQDVYMRRWDAGRVLFIGDAGHGTSPQLGQGANLALTDAHTLAECLRQEPDPTRAWKHYSQQRKGQLYYYVLASRWLTYGFQSHSRVLPWFRDRITLPLSNPKYWLTRKIYQQMLLTLCGQKTGLFSSTTIKPLDTANT